jgi:hypothetical protein
MRYMMSIYTSDVMDLVAATVEIHGWTEQVGPPDIVYAKTYTWPGLGESDPLKWATTSLANLSHDMRKALSKGPDRALPMGGPHTIYESGDGVD